MPEVLGRLGLGLMLTEGAVGTTDRDGRFTIWHRQVSSQQQIGTVAIHQENLSFSLWAFHPERGSLESKFTHTFPQNTNVTDRGDLALVAKAGLEVNVIDTAGEPLPDVVVQVYAEPEHWEEVSDTPYEDEILGYTMDQKPRKGTNALGKVTLRGLPPTTYFVAAAKEGFRPVVLGPLGLKETGETKTISLTLHGGQRGLVRVVQADGKPAPGLRVSLNLFLGGLSGEEHHTTTNEKGEGHWEGLPKHLEGGVEVSAHDQTLGSWPLDQPASELVTLQLKPEGSLVFKLNDQKGHLLDRAALEGAWVSLQEAVENDHSVYRHASYRDGLWRVNRFPASLAKLEITGRTFEMFTKPDVQIQRGKETDLGTLTLHRLGQVSGILWDKGLDRPVSDTQVKLKLEGPQPPTPKVSPYSTRKEIKASYRKARMRNAKGYTDGEGRFLIKGVYAGRYTLSAGYKNYRVKPVTLSVSVPDGEKVTGLRLEQETPAELELGALGTLSGRAPSEYEGFQVSLLGIKIKDIVKNGTYKIEQIPPGKYQIYVQLNGSTDPVNNFTKEVVDIPRAGNVTYHLKPYARTLIEGQILDQEGRSVQADLFHCWVDPYGNQYYVGSSGKDGRYKIVGIGAVSYKKHWITVKVSKTKEGPSMAIHQEAFVLEPGQRVHRDITGT